MLRRILNRIITITNLNNVMTTQQSTKKPIISIIGTTGVGKSQLSIQLAQRFNGEIINADSMQMYKGIDQITNKHPIEEREGIVHHVMNHVDWNEEYYIHRFKKEALDVIDDIHKRGKIPIVVGGTHYYLQSLLFTNKTIETGKKEHQERPVKPEDGFEKLTEEEKMILDGPPDMIFKQLAIHDPTLSQKFHPNDHRRIRRALEICYITKRPASEIYQSQRKSETDSSSLRFNTLFFWLYSDPQLLDIRLDQRVNKMMDFGGLEELSQLYDYYCKKEQELGKVELDRGVWQAIGFKEFLPYLSKQKNDILSVSKQDVLKDETFKLCLDDMKLRTRRYARTQIKWIKNLLVPELANEGNHGWANGGKIYALDASDLTTWNENVGERGSKVCDEFLNPILFKLFDVKQLPDSLKDQKLGLVEANNNEQKDKFDESKWKHYTCDTCLDKDKSPLIFVGDQFQIHLNSRKHRTNLTKGKRKREYEEWLASKEGAKKRESEE